MQILAFEGTAYKIVAGIFSFVAKVYDVMITLSRAGTDAGSIDEFPISDVATVMYTIAGVFMLFRVTIAMINMLINPDAINDGKTGAGKLITRIVTSILLLIAFVPNGWIFGTDGILNRLESALLAPNGLINNLLPDNVAGAGGNSAGSNSDTTNTDNAINNGTNVVKDIADEAVKNVQNSVAMNGLTDNVYAAGKTLDCYWVEILDSDTTTSKKQDAAGVSKSIIDYYHVTFYDHKEDNAKTMYSGTGNINSSVSLSYSYVVDTSGKYKDITYKNIPYGSIAGGDSFTNNNFPNECPKRIEKSSNGGTSVGYKNYKDSNVFWYNAGSGILGGWESEDKMAKSLEKHKNEFLDESGAEVEGSSLFNEVRNPEAVVFAQTTMGTFMSCGDSEECETLKMGSLVTDDDNIIENMKNDTLKLDFIPAVIAGIGILIWVLVLCVDIIVRRFKLLLLQMIAPIPIISYVDPNDQIFDKWKKMYISTYVDLFIKLIAISFAIYLLKIVDVIYDANDKTILKFFYIVAILVFAKMIPSMISDIFGIKNMGGSFKDITGMGKAALGFGAGAAIGGLTGFATGKGVGGRLGGTFKGMAMGAGSGTKGNLTGGAKAIAASNYNLQNARANGLSFSDRLIGGIQSSVGIDPKKRIEDKIKGKEFLKSNVNDVQTAVSDVEKSLEGTNVMKDLKNAFDRGEIDMNAYKSGMSQLAQIWDKGGVQSKDASGKNTGFYETKIQIRDKDGNMYGGSDGLTVKAESGFYEGYKSAVSRFDKTIGTIGSNSDVARTLHDDYGLNLKSGKEGKFDQIQDIKGTTFGADSMLQEEIIGLKNGPDMQKAQAIDSYNAGRK